MNEKELKPPPTVIRSLILDKLDEPVLFQRLICDWEILSWDLKKWADKLGNKLMPFRSGVNEITTIPQWERTCTKRQLTMKEFVEFCGRETHANWLYFDYKYMHEWFQDNYDVLSAVDWKNFGFPEIKGDQSSVWIGTNGAHTPCHYDTYGCNLVAQVYGTKQWILFPPNNSDVLLPSRVPYEESSVYSKLNFHSPDLHLIRDLQKAWVITLKPGDVLFVPQKWWHYVENIGTAISINTWLPLTSDSEQRLEESIVRLIVSHLTKGVPDVQNLLNPNEDDLHGGTSEESILLLQTTMQQFCEQQLEKECQISVKETNTWKRMKTDAFTDSQDITTLPHFKSYIHRVPILTGEQLFDFLASKRCRFNSTCSDVSTQSSVSITTEKVINAVCHPDVISIIKAKLCQEFCSTKL